MVQGKEKTMLDKREILLQLRKGYSIRKVSRDLKVHRDIVRSVYRTAHHYGWANPISPMPGNAEIESILNNKSPKPSPSLLVSRKK